MGDRAVITTEEAFRNGGLGVYVHWNGDMASVTAYLAYCEMQGFRSPDEDPWYGFARLVQVIANTFDTGISVGIGRAKDMCATADYDNGTYLIEGWRIRANVVRDERHEGLDDFKADFGRIRTINYCQPGNIQFSSSELLDRYHEYERGREGA